MDVHDLWAYGSFAAIRARKKDVHAQHLPRLPQVEKVATQALVVHVRLAITGKVVGSFTVLSTEPISRLRRLAERLIEKASKNLQASLLEHRLLIGAHPLPTSGLVGEYLQHGDFIEAISISLVAATATHSTVTFWSLATKTPELTLNAEAEVSCVAFSPDGTQVVTGTSNGSVQAWCTSGSRLSGFQAHRSSITSLSFAPKGGAILTSSHDHTARIWDYSTWTGLSSFYCQSSISSAVFSSDGGMLATGCSNRSVQVWAVGGSRDPLARLLNHGDIVTSVAFAPDAMALATASSDFIARIWTPKDTSNQSRAFRWSRWIQGVS